MARQRSRGRGSSKNKADVVEVPDIDTATQEIPTTNTNTVKTGERKMAGLTADQIQALLGQTRTKGQYLVYLNKFIDSGEQGIDVQDEWVDLREKKESTLKQGFENAKQNKEAHEDAQFVRVLVNDGKVYLINLKAAGVAADETDEVDEAA